MNRLEELAISLMSGATTPPDWLKTPGRINTNTHDWAMSAPGAPPKYLHIGRDTRLAWQTGPAGERRLAPQSHPANFSLGDRLNRLARDAEKLEKAKVGEVKRARLLRPLGFAISQLVAKVSHGERVVERLKRKQARSEAIAARMNAKSISLKEAQKHASAPLQSGQIIEVDGALRRVA